MIIINISTSIVNTLSEIPSCPFKQSNKMNDEECCFVHDLPEWAARATIFQIPNYFYFCEGTPDPMTVNTTKDITCVWSNFSLKR